MMSWVYAFWPAAVGSWYSGSKCWGFLPIGEAGIWLWFLGSKPPPGPGLSVLIPSWPVMGKDKELQPRLQSGTEQEASHSSRVFLSYGLCKWLWGKNESRIAPLVCENRVFVMGRVLARMWIHASGCALFEGVCPSCLLLTCVFSWVSLRVVLVAALKMHCYTKHWPWHIQSAWRQQGHPMAGHPAGRVFLGGC